MAGAPGTITVEGASGSAVVVLSGNAYASSHASMFQSMMAQVVTSGSGFYPVLGGSPLVVVGDNQGTVGLIGGNASSTILVGDGTSLSYFGSASVAVVGGDGQDSVFSGIGDDTIALGTGANMIYLGSGNSIVYSEGADFIQAGGGVDTIDVTGSQASIYGGYGGSLLVDDQFGTDATIHATAGTAVRASDVSETAVVATGDTTVTGGLGNTIVTQQAGTLTLMATGGGTALVDDGSPGVSDTIYGADGSTVRLVASSHDNVFVANQAMFGSNQSVLFDGSQASGGNQFWAGSGNATLIGGTGQDTLVAGSGDTTMTGGTGGANTFDFFHPNGGAGCNATITDFGAAAGNTITLFGYGIGGILTALDTAQQVGSSTVFKLNDGTSVTLEGFQKSHLTASSFLYTNPSP